MGELKDTEVYEEELIDYEEEDEKALDSTKPTTESVKKLVFFLLLLFMESNFVFLYIIINNCDLSCCYASFMSFCLVKFRT